VTRSDTLSGSLRDATAERMVLVVVLMMLSSGRVAASSVCGARCAGHGLGLWGS
jgi:hypothetical protein